MDATDYQIAIISALPLELACIVGMLDERFPSPPQRSEDHNTYVCGRIGKHNVVLACLPFGVYGTVSAANVASRIVQSFPAFKFGLMVGIGAGVPRANHDIRLGDVVVGTPNLASPGVVRYDSGKSVEQGRFIRTGTFNRPPDLLLTAISALHAEHRQNTPDLSKYILDMAERFPQMQDTHKSPGYGQDYLFLAEYEHEGGSETCRACDHSKLVTREPRSSEDPIVHYGTIASGDQVMRHASSRDRIAAEVDALCFEMEAAGLTDFPCLVIRGICDYADSHKNKQWQPYAAATAAAYAKELLQHISTGSKRNISTDEYNLYLKSLKDLQISNPRDDMTRILATKNPLLEGSCDWIFEEEAFKVWWTDSAHRILWTHGDPGKGKTMIMIAAIKEISRRQQATPAICSLGYFFCETSMQRDAVSVLKGLIYGLVDENPGLAKHLQAAQASQDEKNLYSGPNTLYSLWNILSKMLRDTACPRPILMIDALDECVKGLSELLQLISTSESNARWFLTSRNIDEIKEWFESSASVVHTSLEINSAQVSSAVRSFIRWKVEELAQMKSYPQELQTEIMVYLEQNAQDTFLWVALVCKELRKVRQRARVSKHLRNFPPELDSLYDRMLQEALEDVDHEFNEYKLRLLRLVTLSVQPRKIEELSIACNLPEQWSHPDDVEQIIAGCGSFLVVRNDEVVLVHASAWDYLVLRSELKIFPHGINYEHAQIAIRSLDILATGLKYDICSLQDPGTLVEEVEVSHVHRCIPFHLQYACKHWLEHVVGSALGVDSPVTEAVVKRVDRFYRLHFLYWLEAMSLLRDISNIMFNLRLLKHSVEMWRRDIFEIVQDAHLLISNHKYVIETAPLQLYSSVLVFCPTESLIRKQYLTYVPDGLLEVPSVDTHWSPCVQSLESSDPVASIAVSLNFDLVASTRRVKDSRSSLVYDHTITLWDARSGAVRFTLVDNNKGVLKMSFAPNDKQLICSCGDGSENIWDVTTGLLVAKLWAYERDPNPDGPNVEDWFAHHAFTSDGAFICARGCGPVTVWDTATWLIRWQSVHLRKIAKLAASGSNIVVTEYVKQDLDRDLRLELDFVTDLEQNSLHVWTWNSLNTEPCYLPLGIHQSPPFVLGAVAISKDLHLLASLKIENERYRRGYIDILDLANVRRRHSLNNYGDPREHCILKFSPNGDILLSTAWNYPLIESWKTNTGEQLPIIRATAGLTFVEWFPDSAKIASAHTDFTVNVWFVRTGTILCSLSGHSNGVCDLFVSIDGYTLYSASHDGSIKVWDTRLAEQFSQEPSEESKMSIDGIEISHSNRFLATLRNASEEVEIWDLQSGLLCSVLSQPLNRYRSIGLIRFAPDDATIAVFREWAPTAGLWNIRDGKLLSEVIHSNSINHGFAADFANDSKKIFYVSKSGGMSLRCVASGKELVEFLPIPRDEDSKWTTCSYLDSARVAAAKFAQLHVWDVVSTAVAQQLFVIPIDHHHIKQIYPVSSSKCIALLYDMDPPGYSQFRSALSRYSIRLIDFRTVQGTVTEHSDRTNFSSSCLILLDAIVQEVSKQGIEYWAANLGTCVTLKHEPQSFRVKGVQGPTTTVRQTVTPYALTDKTRWISRFGKPWLWIPSAYRPQLHERADSNIVLVLPTQRLLIMRCQPISEDDPRLEVTSDDPRLDNVWNETIS